MQECTKLEQLDIQCNVLMNVVISVANWLETAVLFAGAQCL